MKMFGLILPKVSSRRDHVPTGKVMTLHSNTRWCSDAFEVQCFNGEKVYTAFALDCKDREAISFVSSCDPLTSIEIQNLMVTSVENRFQGLHTPRQIEWLTDRGSIYRALNVRQTAFQLGLKCCYTASYSPQSNGMAESFVKTFKRDYVYNNDCHSAEVVMKMIPQWMEDYDTNAPHSALGMMSPMEYKGSQF